MFLRSQILISKSSLPKIPSAATTCCEQNLLIQRYVYRAPFQFVSLPLRVDYNVIVQLHFEFLFFESPIIFFRHHQFDYARKQDESNHVASHRKVHDVVIFRYLTDMPKLAYTNLVLPQSNSFFHSRDQNLRKLSK